ncbi:MAG: two-component system, LuxR family, response regulator FixJ [Sphingomonadales bacterium]|nr:two-component system, LuxR family, response regulator FixJ [Sphingomonadales bacterium]
MVGPPPVSRFWKGRALSSRIVYVVDDDRNVRLMLSYMLGDADLQSRPFASGSDFLSALPDLDPGCILLDVRMPDMDGLAVMAELARRAVGWPVVFMTGHGEVPVAVEAMKLGAIDFLQKPFSEEALLASFERGFTLLDERKAATTRRADALARVELLSSREREVLQGLLAGLPNKQIADRLGISLRTVEMHRGNMMDRLGVDNLAEALTLAMESGLTALVAKAG